MSVLEGIRVIDFGQYRAGPMAAMLLADHGANVIRVDPPGGPFFRTPANATWNRGKRSIVLDLKRAEDLAVARRLIATADVAIENFRPGVMERRGLGAADSIAANPRLIYCSLPGFASDDPRAHLRAWEGVLAAATGTYRPDAGGDADRPIYTIVPYGSAFGAFLAVDSILAALYARDRSGCGQILEVPLYNATFTAMGIRCLRPHDRPRRKIPFNFSRQARCKDGTWFMYVALNKHNAEFFKRTGIAAWQEAGLGPAELDERFKALFRTRTAAEWDALCIEIGTEGAPCLTSVEWMSHPQAIESGIVAEFEDEELGRFRGPGLNVHLSASPGSIRAPRPRLDAHRAEILAELDKPAPAPRIASPVSEAGQPPLAGIKVLDLCVVLAGPVCGRTLAEFGADVIKIDGANMDWTVHTGLNPTAPYNETNRGKRSLVLDLKRPEGRDILWRLIDQADVILQNFRPGMAAAMGIDYEMVRARRPDIVYCSLNGYGQKGPYADRPCHEQIAQAITGMQMRYGGDRPVLAPFPANDYGTGLMGAFAVLLALLHRRRTGQGQFVDSALAYTATLLQSDVLQDYPGKLWNEPSGQAILGEGPLYRAYRARDGWIFLAARRQGIAACPALADLADESGDALERRLESRFAAHSVAEWETWLAAADIGAHRVVLDYAELMDDPLVRAQGLSLTRRHDEIGMVTTVGPGIKASLTPPAPGRPAPKPGSDAPSILAEIGLADQLERLVGAGVVIVDGVPTI